MKSYQKQENELRAGWKRKTDADLDLENTKKSKVILAAEKAASINSKLGSGNATVAGIQKAKDNMGKYFEEDKELAMMNKMVTYAFEQNSQPREKGEIRNVPFGSQQGIRFKIITKRYSIIQV